MSIAFIYPGQGAQFVGMGRDLYENNGIFKQVFEACSEASGINLKAVCFNGENQTLGEYIQPAIFANSVALTAVIKDAGIYPDCVGGLSLGEYAALCAAGVFSPEVGSGLVSTRGKLMDEGVPSGSGGMASVIGLNIEAIQAVIKQQATNVWIANYISEGQTVIGGVKTEVESLADPLKEAGAKLVQILNVAGPFHTVMLKDASEAFDKVLDNVDISSPKTTVYSNVLGMPYADQAIKPLLVEQMISSVKWHQCVKHMVDNGVDTLVEIGPGNVLGKTIQRGYKSLKRNIFSVQDIKTLEKALETLT
jgi:[acyl-carrier-protein] S-malonyltransferase